MTYEIKPKQSFYFIFLMSGLLGGFAEIVWMYLYNTSTNIGLKEISNEIVRTLHISSSNHYIGLIIHLSLSSLIGVVCGKLMFEKFCKNNLFLIILSSLLILACIWICTFKLILPAVNIDMANIVPGSISFISKMLFGIFMALSYYKLYPIKKRIYN